ncbi:hypothetical protein LTR85_001493 [Meristemomyces frigidus]|nr:hypothetical protein LTR85_001493 [Meristemomyces frigidus]
MPALDTLCACCEKLDLSQLFHPLNLEDTTHTAAAPRSAKDCEDQRAIWVQNSSLIQALRQPDCSFCAFIVECALRAGLFEGGALPEPSTFCNRDPSGAKGAIVRAQYKKVAEHELSLRWPYDLIINVFRMDDDWWVGEYPGGSRGYFPSDYVDLLELVDDGPSESQAVPTPMSGSDSSDSDNDRRGLRPMPELQSEEHAVRELLHKARERHRDDGPATRGMLRSIRYCIRPTFARTPRTDTFVSAGQLNIRFYTVKTESKTPSWLTQSSDGSVRARPGRPSTPESLQAATAAGLSTLDIIALHRLPSNPDDEKKRAETDAGEDAESFERSFGNPQLSELSAVASWRVDVVKSSELGGNSTRKADTTLSRVPILSTIDSQTLRSWVHICSGHHDHAALDDCAQLRLQQVPHMVGFRAIHTESGNILPLPAGARYAVLSYVWGPAQWLPSTADYPLSSEASSPATAFPPTVQDAVELANRLAFEWLWVDRFCINQQDEAEKASLIPFIKDIFALAELTIVAASGNGAHTGLHGVRKTLREVEKPLAMISKHGTLTVLPTPSSFNSLLEDSAWRTRGWAFEEHVFSRRLLYIFPNEVIFSCNEGMFRESTGMAFVPGSAGTIWGDAGATPPSIAAMLNAKLQSKSAVMEKVLTTSEYVRAVKHYTTRELSFEEDRVKAFAGLVTAASMSSDLSEDVPSLLHGHPMPFFETLLTWHYDGDRPRRLPSREVKFVPSWSWASAGRGVHFLDDGQQHSKNCWFRYTLLKGYDVLGLPATKDIPLVSSLRLVFPEAMYETCPWESATHAPPPSYEESAYNPGHGEVLKDRLSLLEGSAFAQADRRLPSLHLLTVVFEANLYPASEGQHSLVPLNASSSARSRLTGYWSLSDDTADVYAQPQLPDIHSLRLDSDGAIAATATGSSQRAASQFAIVGGNRNMYVMLLAPQSEAGVFTRAGLSRVSLPLLDTGGGSSARTFSFILAKGNPRWEYIRID